MTKTSVIDRLKEACERDGDIAFRADYSGRNMYGSACVGIVGGRAACQRLIAEVIATAGQDMLDATPGDPTFSEFYALVKDLMGFASDSMGRDAILYFPAVQTEVADASAVCS